MKSMLLNFGTNDRVVSDVDNGTHVVPIGGSATFEVHPLHEAMIRKGMALGDALIILPEGSEAPPELPAVAAMLANITTADYDLLVNAYHQVAPMNGADIRPDRNTMRTNLEKIGLMLSRGEKVPRAADGKPIFIREEQTPETPKQPEPKPKPQRTKDKITTDAVNEALGLGSTEDTKDTDVPDRAPKKTAKSKKPRAARKPKERAAA
jgi:hypothetical protein